MNFLLGPFAIGFLKIAMYLFLPLPYKLITLWISRLGKIQRFRWNSEVVRMLHFLGITPTNVTTLVQGLPASNNFV